jgi:hypothetical protein
MLVSKSHLQIYIAKINPSKPSCWFDFWNANHQTVIADLLPRTQTSKSGSIVCFPGCRSTKVNCKSAFQDANRQNPFADLQAAMQIGKTHLQICFLGCRSSKVTCSFTFRNVR